MKNTKRLFSLFFFSLLITASSVVAQTGKVAGNVIDGDYNNEPLAFANILVKGTTTGTTSDFDGKYELELDPGTYTLVFSFVGYETKEISDVVISADQVFQLDVTLSTNALEQVVITTTVKRNTESSLLNLQKRSVTLLDGLSAQSIKKTGASNIATAVKSVPGVSVQGGKYVYVRGLGDRYTKSILNGVDIPGLDPDRNTIPMDIFPTNLIDNVIVLKSAAAEYPADFTGGIVNIVTKDFPTKAEYGISLGAGYNPDMHFNDQYLSYEGSDTDFFGFDDGERNLPINRYQQIPGTFENKQLLNTLTGRFNRQLRADQETSNLNYSIGFTAGNQYEVGEDQKLGYLASISYKNNTRFFEERIDGNFQRDNQNTSNNQLQLTRRTVGAEGTNEILVSALGGVTYKTKQSKYKFTLMHIQNGESSAGLFTQRLSQDAGGGAFEDVVKDGLLYTERSITNIALTGSHQLDTEADWKFDWTFSPSFSKVEDKDHRITPLEVTQDDDFIISPSTSSFPVRLWRWLLEENWVTKTDFSKKYNLFERPAKVKFGGAYTYKFRDFSIDEFLFSATDLTVPGGNSNNLLTDANIWSPDTGEGTFLLSTNRFEPANAYEGEARVAAAYVSNEFNVTEKLKAILGLRIEDFQLFYTGARAGSGTETFEDLKVIDEFDFYPSANFIYALNDQSNLRASFSRSTARPSFKEQSFSRIFDPITNVTFIGALNFNDERGGPLRPTYINNFDIRYEIFREEGQMIAVSGFYKDFTDPIELKFVESTVGSGALSFTPDNLGNAEVFGAEVEFRQNFGFILESLRNLKLNINASIIESRLTMSDDEFNSRTAPGVLRDGETVDRERELQGQSPYLVNVGLDYGDNDKGFRAGLFFNVQGETLEIVGAGNTPDVYTLPFNSLNFTFNKTFGSDKRSSIDLKINNILGDDRESVYQSFGAQDQIFSLRSPGTEFSLGYSYKF
ncbi:TonB-dependent receptor [Winogradskyella sp. 3972H.M.0a.05]|uniref:TonB-dependent receptor n=1 Tax=Winogradskyella sp. 3972H.M.0a.05 TaxID=2950277 RepID=UPI0033910776